MVPLLPYLVPMPLSKQVFWVSTGLTCATFFAIGLLKGRVLRQALWLSGLETLLVGGAAAGLAYVVGELLQGLKD